MKKTLLIIFALLFVFGNLVANSETIIKQPQPSSDTNEQGIDEEEAPLIDTAKSDDSSATAETKMHNCPMIKTSHTIKKQTCPNVKVEEHECTKVEGAGEHNCTNTDSTEGKHQCMHEAKQKEDKNAEVKTGCSSSKSSSGCSKASSSAGCGSN
ncbi:hypothetical protein KAH81_01980 [bacterium]|nr:hypothetical protein [bacterium]